MMNNTVVARIFTGMFLLSMPFLLYPLLAKAQQTIPKRSHSLNNGQQLTAKAPDSLTIIAIRIQFQEDNNRLTTGNGTFQDGNLSYLDRPDITLDPLPHNESYFKSHLRFAKNYFETVSGQQMHVEYRVLGPIYQLNNKMERYSPTGQNFTNEKVAQLVRDSWQAVKNNGGFSTDTLDPQKTAFVIFHAGVGRDIELIGTNLDKTPQDIPSLFMNQNTLGDLLNAPAFDGFAINNTSFRITNSMVLPRTLSRKGKNAVGEEFVLQLSINGLFTASIGSYLGLPDLFNTTTGSSGIGRFGLMDGESFFSYRGLFPPEPSAWEKIFLGWQSPFMISKNTGGPIALPAVAFHQNNSIAKYSLSRSEYFLIENRHRAPAGNNLTLTFQQPDGTETTKNFSNTDQIFTNQSDGFTDLFPKGVLTDVSNFDWSLPGGIDVGTDGKAGTSDDRILNGGILIWHIDEAVIERSLTDQTVNANPQRRGVDLEEADGAQDIGRPASDDFSQQARGTAFDFWWSDNDASVITLSGDTLSFYENRFGPNTRPSNESNSGARNFFELFNFSANQSTATFRVRPTSGDNISTIPLAEDEIPDQAFTSANEDYYKSYPLQLSLYKAQSDSFLIIPGRQSAYAINLGNNSNSLFDFQSGNIQQPFQGSQLVLGQPPIGNQIMLSSWNWDGSSWNTNWTNSANANDAFISANNAQTLSLDFTDQQINANNGSFSSPLAQPKQRSEIIDGQFSSIQNGKLQISSGNGSFAMTSATNRRYTGVVKLSAKKIRFYLLTDEQLLVFNPNDIINPNEIIEGTPLEWPAMTDLDEDGKIDFLFVNKSTQKLEARNINGAMLAHFPLSPPKGSSFIGTPLIANTSSSNSPHIYITAQDSVGINIYGYSKNGKELDGFPLYVGAVNNQQNQPVHPILKTNILYAVSHEGSIKAWKINNITKVLWGNRYGNAPFNKVSGINNTSPSSNHGDQKSILVKEETYNWPNPAKDFTNIRFKTSGSGHVDLKVITAGGTVVLEKQFNASGGTAEEHRISTKDWSSGLYLAMVTAKINGEQARKMIKMVVVH
ncbi:M6 family metalloprotease domain-containing protein [Fodinibius salinus]|uniref:M6 family metalloprotease domain-containing protein n=1 Tax=Fodinibius salinus TaxID=860790 RepID=A0A5D3YLF0_9BACT|nr:T9SS type A sorting domain-containing protein [Fodinibius salinus]TYP94764.1 M6 family metalloprotease domain-containing protein [Fodinibius salinus]